MQASEKKLLTTQADDVMRAILHSGLAPTDFEIASRPSTFQQPAGHRFVVSEVIHKPSRGRFVFDWVRNDRWSRYSPGQERLEDYHGDPTWDSQLRSVGRWLGYLGRELGAPDLWTQVERSGIGMLTLAAPDSYFTSEEVQQLKAQLDALERQLIEEHDLRGADAEAVREELGQVREELGKLNRRMWTNLVIGTLTKLALTVPPLREEIGDLLARGLALITGFLNNPPPILPPH